MILSVYDLSTALADVFLPREEGDTSQIFFPEIVDEDLPTFFSKLNY